MDISSLDKNLQVITDINEPDVVLHDVKEDPFEVYGLYDYKNSERFTRMDPEVSKSVSDAIYRLSNNTAGGRVRFATDSEYIAISASYYAACHFSHMSLTGSAGFDLYIDDPEFGTSTYRHTFVPPSSLKESYTAKLKFGEKKLRYITINFPTYSSVKSLHIGLQKDARIEGGMKYRDIKPVIYYGSSITQGGCCSRPGNAYQAVVSRKLNIDFINLGFSGNAKGEQAIAEYIGKLPCSVFVFDYDHNAALSELRATHKPFYETVRRLAPELPIVFMSRCDVDCAPHETDERRGIIMETLMEARQNGDKNVYFIDGAELFKGPFEDMCTVDRCHPNDIGFALMANAVEAQLLRIYPKRT